VKRPAIVDFLLIVALLLMIQACGQHATLTTPSNVTKPPTVVEVHSYGTGATNRIMIEDNEPQPPSCDWRNLVVARHINLGGPTNDIVILSNGHRVFIEDRSEPRRYRLEGYPKPWCVPIDQDVQPY